MMVAFRSVEAHDTNTARQGGPTMLRTIKKLVLRRNTIRTLNDTDLAIVDGAGVDITACTAHTRDASTCLIAADGIAPKPGQK
jgi:hypothetical protein